MVSFHYSKRSFAVAALLGFAALALDIINPPFGVSGLTHLSSIFLFLSAGALGLNAAFVSLAIGAVPYHLMASTPLEGLRIICLVTAVGAMAEYRPKLPQFVATLAAWVAFTVATFAFGAHSKVSAGWTLGTITAAGFEDILISMIAGALLLNREVWGAITQRPRIVSAVSLLVHVMAIVACTSVIGAVAITGGDSTLFSETGVGDALRLSLLMAVSLLGPVVVGWRLALKMTRDSKELFGSILQGDRRSFSGLSSDYWRRNKSEDTESTNKSTSPSADNDLGLTPEIGICAINRSGTVTFINRKFRELTGASINEAVGKDIFNIGLPIELSKKILDIVEFTLGHGSRVSEYKLNQLPNPLRFLELSAFKADQLESSTISEGPDSVIIKVKDITERRTVESHLLQGQKLASLGNFVSGFAHSFNNALTAIAGHASFAKHITDPAELAKSLDEVLAATSQAGDVVRKLLEFADGRPSLMKREQLGDAIARCLALLKNVTGVNHEIEFEKTGPDPYVFCDMNLLMQALTNLVLNSRDSYEEKAGSIRIDLGRENIDKELAGIIPGASPGEFARLRVIDSGKGMSAEVLHRAFDPLFTTRSNTGHPGLGLSIVYAIVRAHDGFLTVESKPERGTTVSIYLPVTVPEELTSVEDNKVAEDTNARKRISELYGNKEKILVVEDEPKVRDLISTMLSTIGYSVTSCSNGEEALAQCSTNPFDLVLVDMVMPKMNGLEFLSKMKASANSARALMMTGYGLTGHNSTKGMSLIPKPFDIDTLARAVKSSLAEPPSSAYVYGPEGREILN